MLNKKNITHALSVVFLPTLLLLSACGPQSSHHQQQAGTHDLNTPPGNGSTPPEQVPGGGDGGPSAPTPPPSRQGKLACYLNSCFETVSLQKISDPNNDYAYPDPKNFSHPELRPQYVAPTSALDLTKIDPATKVSPNFTFGEFMSPSKGKYGLFSSDVVTILQLMRNKINKPMVINSGYRSPGYNSGVGGSASWSRHTYGDGVDIFVSGMSIRDLQSLCYSKQFGASFASIYPAHVHCDWRMNPLDPAFYSVENKSMILFAHSTAELMSSASSISVNMHGQNRVVSVVYPNDDVDEGEPIYDWQITLPSGEILEAHTPTVQLPNMQGTFNIHVVVAGAIEVQSIYQW